MLKLSSFICRNKCAIKFQLLWSPCLRNKVTFAMEDWKNETKAMQEPSKRPWNENNQGDNRKPKKNKFKNPKNVKKVSGIDDVLQHDIVSLFKAQTLQENPQLSSCEEQNKSFEQLTSATLQPKIDSTGSNVPRDSETNLIKPFTEIEVEVKEISSTGEGLAIHPESKRIYVVPFSVPGDIIKAKVIKHHVEENYSTADFVSVVKAGPLRDDSRINCKYFSKCSGCQFQMLDYETQLKHKQTIVEKAYKNFSKLPKEMIPLVGNTIGSPLQYGYRTKLTPHFDAPKGYISKADKMKGVKNRFKEVPDIGFNAKGKFHPLDIEDCPIGTDAVRMGMKRERTRMIREFNKYTKGATLLLRESTLRLPNSQENLAKTVPHTVKVTGPDFVDFKSCVTDNKAKTVEYVDNFIFTNIANEFFQNNNSILSKFTQYIRDHIIPASSNQTKIKNLIDAYSGSGLFTITLSSLFESSLGIDVSVASITSAEENARENKLLPSRAKFIAADASTLFKEINYHPDETVVLIDPSRKGCDQAFISQLLNFSPKRVVYVSCNVHTQARDVGLLVRGLTGLEGEVESETKYEIESLRGFDFFPQTSHVEGVAILNRLDKKSNIVSQ